MRSVRIRDVSGVYQKTQRGSSLIRVSGMYQLAFASISDVSAASPHLPPLPAHPDVVKLGPLQRRAKHLKKQKVVQVQVESLLELKQFLLNYRMPNSISIATLQGPSTLSALLDDDGGAAVLTEIQKKGLVYVMQADAYDVEGVCLTGPQQIQWIGQLAKLALRFVLHIDSKWKLHHGVWVCSFCCVGRVQCVLRAVNSVAGVLACVFALRFSIECEFALGGMDASGVFRSGVMYS